MGDNSNNEGAQKQVVIVGGGIAGLAAARKLQNTGQFVVNVLEARRERYGGRIFTDRSSFKLAKGKSCIYKYVFVYQIKNCLRFLLLCMLFYKF